MSIGLQNPIKGLRMRVGPVRQTGVPFERNWKHLSQYKQIPH